MEVEYACALLDAERRRQLMLSKEDEESRKRKKPHRDMAKALEMAIVNLRGKAK